MASNEEGSTLYRDTCPSPAPKPGPRKRLSNKSLEFTAKILRLLDAGYYPAKIGITLGHPKATINYHVMKLKELGYITALTSVERSNERHLITKSRGIATYYELTPLGTKFLDGFESGRVDGRLRLHEVR